MEECELIPLFTHPMKNVITIFLLAFALNSLNAQNLVYNLTGKSTYVGQYSTNYASKGYIAVLPYFSYGSDNNYFETISFYTWTYKGSKYFTYDENRVSENPYYDEWGNIAGYNIYGGLTYAVAKIGKKFNMIISQNGSFNSESVSGAATYGYIAGTTNTGYYSKALNQSTISYSTDSQTNLGSSSSEYQIASKDTSVNSYVLNTILTRTLISSSYDDVKSFMINYLKLNGYLDATANPVY